MSINDGFESNAFKRASSTGHDEYAPLHKLQADCNPYEQIVRKDDGGILNGWKLHGVMMVIRYGDRGPMAHVRDINSIDCSTGRQVNPLLNKYRIFLSNATANVAAGHYMYTRSGPFHNFPLLPAFTKACLLGQLTYSGVAQLLQIGELLRSVYAHQLDLLRPEPQPPSKSINSTQMQVVYASDDILLFSTRYRRTFQSAMALMYGFLPERWQSLIVRESHSLAFCFADCACARADHIKDLLAKEFANELDQHPTVDAIVQWIGSNILQNPAPKMQALDVRDALLSIICHNAPLPCRRAASFDYVDATANELNTVHSTTESNDLINIDQEDASLMRDGTFVQKSASWQSNPSFYADADGNVIEPETGCVEVNQVSALMSYTHWQSTKEAAHKLTRQEGLLRAYGLLRNIVTNMLKIISGDKLKFALYSGHDRTIHFLFSALGLYRKNGATNSQPKLSYFIPYATRVAFELYKSEAGNGDLTEYYFRVVSNGQDITNRIEFCEGGQSLRIVKDGRGNKADLCPIENIIRFIHDDYFNPLNATNQKEACSM